MSIVLGSMGALRGQSEHILSEAQSTDQQWGIPTDQRRVHSTENDPKRQMGQQGKCDMRGDSGGRPEATS